MMCAMGVHALLFSWGTELQVVQVKEHAKEYLPSVFLNAHQIQPTEARHRTWSRLLPTLIRWSAVPRKEARVCLKAYSWALGKEVISRIGVPQPTDQSSSVVLKTTKNLLPARGPNSIAKPKNL